MGKKIPEVDRYIAKAAPFAQPILEKIRAAFHKASPDIEEAMKWSVPFFDYHGVLGSMAAFKEHVGWGFWKAQLMDDPERIFAERNAMGGAKVKKVSDLPSEKVLVQYVRAAMKLNEEGAKLPQRMKRTDTNVDVPPELTAALKKNAKAKATFDKFPPGQKREYCAWIAEAKQNATREKRLAQAIEWMAEGKPRNWKYMKK